MSPEIKCSVSNCSYWDNMHCAANAIEVNADDSEMQATSSEATCCETFYPKEM